MTQSTKAFSAEVGESSRTWWLAPWQKLLLVFICFYLLGDMNGKYLKYYQLLITALSSFDKLPGKKKRFYNQSRKF